MSFPGPGEGVGVFLWLLLPALAVVVLALWRLSRAARQPRGDDQRPRRP